MRVVESIDVRNTTADAIGALDRAWFDDPKVGALFFSIFQAGERHTPEYLAAYERLNVFDTWPASRCRIVDEVTDATFDPLFATPPAPLREECYSMLSVCRAADAATFRARDGHLEIRYDPATGTAYTGFEPHEFNLPSGEIAFRCLDLAGKVAFRGWLIGTIPFGQKYGRIREGQLVLTFENRRITRIDGDAALARDLDAALTQSDGLRSVNELGIGLHRAAAQTARNVTVGLQWMEKSRGMHLGLGAELSEHIDDYRARQTHHHLDLVFDDGELAIGGRTVLAWP